MTIWNPSDAPFFNKGVLQCVVPENIHTSPMEGIFFQDLSPSGNSN